MKEHNCGVALSSLSKVMDKRVIAKLVWPVCQLPIGERRHVYPNRSIIHKECYLRAQDKGADVNVTVEAMTLPKGTRIRSRQERSNERPSGGTLRQEVQPWLRVNNTPLAIEY